MVGGGIQRTSGGTRRLLPSSQSGRAPIQEREKPVYDAVSKNDMNPENYGDITEGTLAWLRMQQGDCVPIMTAILGVAEMAPLDHLRTRQEVCEYVDSGDVGAARALIQ